MRRLAFQTRPGSDIQESRQVRDPKITAKLLEQLRESQEEAKKQEPDPVVQVTETPLPQRVQPRLGMFQYSEAGKDVRCAMTSFKTMQLAHIGAMRADKKLASANALEFVMKPFLPVVVPYPLILVFIKQGKEHSIYTTLRLAYDDLKNMSLALAKGVVQVHPDAVKRRDYAMSLKAKRLMTILQNFGRELEQMKTYNLVSFATLCENYAYDWMDVHIEFIYNMLILDEAKDKPEVFPILQEMLMDRRHGVSVNAVKDPQDVARHAAYFFEWHVKTYMTRTDIDVETMPSIAFASKYKDLLNNESVPRECGFLPHPCLEGYFYWLKWLGEKKQQQESQ